MTYRATSFVLALMFALMGVSTVQAQSQDDAISTDPTVPTVNQPVTITFDASDTPLEGFNDDIYAHTGVTTDLSDPEWTCVKNFWPTQDEFSGERDDTRLTPVGDDLYELEIDDIRDYYNANETGCTLEDDEEIQTMNFVFRSTSGTPQTDDKFVALGDPDATLAVTITQPSVSGINPFIIEDGETVDIEAEVTESGESLEEMVLTIDGQEEASTTNLQLSESVTFTNPGNREIEVTASGDQGTEVSDDVTIVVAPPVEEAARPAGVEDGITYDDGDPTTATFSLYAPGKEFVYLIGDFNDWEVDNDYFMNRESTTAFGDSDGAHYWITIDGLTPGEEYGFQYLVDGEIRMGDLFSEKVLTPQDGFIEDDVYPDLLEYPEDETEGFVSVVQTDQDEFQFSDFERPDAGELVIYEFLIRDFNDEKTYASLIDELDYLEGLGVNAIELMPVSNFDGNISWGYNPNYHLALEKSYGPAEDFKQFVEEAHQRGMAVILDVVYNHATDPSPLIQLEGNNPGESRFVGPGHDFNVFNHLNHDHEYIQYWMDRANAHWLETYNVDGYRFDLTKGFVTMEPDNDFETGGFDPNPFYDRRVQNIERMADAMWDVDDSAYIILEHFQRDEELQMAEYRRDEGLQGMMFWQGMNSQYSDASMGFLGGASNLSDTYHPNIGLEPGVANSVTYMESHDEQWMMRNMREFGNASDDGEYDTQELETALERQKLMGGFFLTVPGPRMLWQLGELGYGWGENECLKPGGFDDDGICAPDDPGRTDPKPVRTEEYFNDPDRRAVYETWGALLNLRQEFEPMRSLTSVVNLDVNSGDDPIRYIRLVEGDQEVHIVGNFSLETAETDLSFLDNGTWYDFFPGEEFEINDENRNEAVPMQPSEFHVYVNEPVTFPEEDWPGYGVGTPGREFPPQVAESVDPQELVLGGDAFEADLNDIFSSSEEVSFNAFSSNDLIADASLDGSSLTVTPNGSGTATITLEATNPNGTTNTSFDVTISRVNVAIDRDFGGTPETSANYRLVALPGAVEEPMADVVTGEASVDWQAFWDDGSDEDFLEPYSNIARFNFQAGRGFWLTSRDNWTFEREVDALLTGDDDASMTIELHEGWNIISNPIAQEVEWSAVDDANDGDLQPIYGFEGAFDDGSDTFDSARSGTAYYFLNDDADRETLTIPNPAYQDDDAGVVAAVEQAQAEAEAALQISARTTTDEHELTSAVQVGVQGSDMGVDAVAPPRDFETISLRIQPEDHDGDERTRFLMREHRDLTGAGETFTLNLQTEVETPVEIEASNFEAIEQHEVALIDDEAGTTHDLRAEGPLTLTPGDTQTLRVAVGSQSYIDRALDEVMPEEVSLTTYPNPVRDQATVQYDLPEAEDVRLELYDVLGRRVSTLEEGNQQAGTHEVQLSTDGLASGVYFGRLTVGGETHTQKITVVR